MQGVRAARRARAPSGWSPRREALKTTTIRSHRRSRSRPAVSSSVMTITPGVWAGPPSGNADPALDVGGAVQRGTAATTPAIRSSSAARSAAAAMSAGAGFSGGVGQQRAHVCPLALVVAARRQARAPRRDSTRDQSIRLNQSPESNELRSSDFERSRSVPACQNPTPCDERRRRQRQRVHPHPVGHRRVLRQLVLQVVEQRLVVVRVDVGHRLGTGRRRSRPAGRCSPHRHPVTVAPVRSTNGSRAGCRPGPP